MIDVLGEHKTILVLGQKPPPFHGSNVMAKNAIEALEAHNHSCVFVDKKFSKSIDSVGRFSLRKILRVPFLVREVIVACRKHSPALCLYFLSSGLTPLMVDALLLWSIRMLRVPYVLRFGGLGYKEIQRRAPFPLRSIVFHTLARAHGGIVLGERLKSDVNHAIPDDRLFVVWNAIEYSPPPICSMDKQNVKVLFLANLMSSKGPLEVLQAAKIVLSQRSKVEFVLAGGHFDHSFSKCLREYVQANGLEDRVSMPGTVVGESKNALFSESDIFVFPTKNEAFGIVNVEAMRAGLPVISSFAGAIPEIVEDGVTGFLVDPESSSKLANRILFLIDNPQKRHEMGRLARERFERRYTLENFAKRMDECMKFFLKLQQS